METGRDFDQIIYGAVGLGLYLAECLHPGDYYSVIDEFRKYWITDVSIHEGMTTIIDAALERAKTRLQAEKEITEQFISGKEPTLR